METSLLHHVDMFFRLFRTRLITTYPQLIDKVINTHIWSFCTLVIFGHVMQAFGLASNFGNFQFAGIVATLGLFEVYGSAATIVMDLEGDRSIAYYLTLPTNAFVVVMSMAAGFAFVGILLSFAILPLGQIVLWNTFSLANVSWVKFAITMVLTNIFFGIFTIAVASHVGSMSKIGNVWMRFIFPLWFLGGFQFSWEAVYKIMPSLAYVMLANPIVYVMEGTRATLLGQEGFLPWWTCIVALSFFSIGCWFYAYHKMKRLLDFV